MAIVGTRADALRFLSVSPLIAVGTIQGVEIIRISGRNGLGTAMIRSEGNGRSFAWRAPGSSVYGPAVDIDSGVGQVDFPSPAINVILEDAIEPGKFVQVAVHTAYLPAGTREARVLLADRYNNALAAADISASEAAAGDVKTYTITLRNESVGPLTRIVVWIDPAVSGLEISKDGTVWVVPTTQATGLAMPDLLTNLATTTLHFRRTITAGASADPKVLNQIHANFEGLF